MGVSDDELDRLEATLDKGGVIGTDAIRELVDEIRSQRNTLELAAQAVSLVNRGAVQVAAEAERLVEGYRELMPIDDDGWVIVPTDWPDGFGPPSRSENS